MAAYCRASARCCSARMRRCKDFRAGSTDHLNRCCSRESAVGPAVSITGGSMERRTFWKLLAGTPFFLGFARHALAAQASSLKEVGELQKNWKMLLADGAD